ncbi:Ig-like domain-containing protein [Kitasatospora sp. CM 4170]|uniref:Ig-like domain-containing protein n=1 Tax=Kitasatospora aburaviensis TaxID=67265 RepID=A0ABW1F647_9ACTN|nr:Ig-like domain-containing protein [Kitasatospora sp. CM 4170]WNM46703.1 Ig-like domain-containing protein [Kitasatospora sp. CM 4170]
MSRQFSREAAPSAPAPDRHGAPAARGRRLRPAAAGASAALAAGLLIGWNPPPSAAQQSPDGWSGEHRAVLPSGLTVQLDFAAAPGTAVIAEPGELADRSGGGRAAALYTDGLRPGDPAQAFRIAPERSQADGSWRTVGTLQLTFSRAVRNPRLHLSGLAGTATGKGGSTSTATRLTLTGGSPSAPTLVNRTDWPGWTVDGNTLAPAGADGADDGSAGSAAEGSLELVGTFRTAVFRVELRSTARAGSSTPPEPLDQAYTVTLDEGVSTAPQVYGNASHLLSDLFLGADAGATGPNARRPATGDGTAPKAVPAGVPAGADGEPLVQLDHGAGRRSVWSSPAPPQLQPGHGDYQGADPAISYPAEAAIGRYYRLTVPVSVGGAPATLAGWIDFDRNGRFDATERVQAELQPGADSATLEWTVPSNAASGETWARLRIGRDAAQLVPAGGFADSGQVSDQRIRLTVGAARPEIAAPVDGAVVADARPQVRGGGAVAGATVEVRDGDGVLCRARVERTGDWACRPGAPLGAGPHSLTPVETTSGGLVLRGEPVRITVKTAPPAAPVLTVPEFTNDPGLQLTGTGEAGSTVSVVDEPAGARGGPAVELCSTAVRSDGAWSCLPVENLPDGRHRLTPSAVDAAGNRTTGRAAGLVVDTVPPDRPVLTVPAAGETVRVARPKLAGRAEPGATVIVTARSGRAASAERIVACGATAAVDGSWVCTANRDLVDGEQWLVVTATDQAGNGTAADAVAVTVRASAPSATAVPAAPSASAPASASAAPSVAVTPTVTPTVTVPAAPSAPATSAPAPGGAPTGGAPSPAASPAGVTASTPPAVSPSAASASASVAVPVPAAPATPAVEPVPVPVPPGLLPITVPPVTGTSAPDASAAPAAVGAQPPSAPTAAGGTTSSPLPSGSPSASPAPPVAPSAVSSPSPSSPSSQSPSPSASPVSPSATPSVTPSDSRPAAPSTAPAAAAATATTHSATATTSAAAAVAAGRSAAEPSRALAAPPVDRPTGPGAEASQTASDHSRSDGWRGGLAGVLLLLAGVGLITRRVFARGPGRRRR